MPPEPMPAAIKRKPSRKPARDPARHPAARVKMPAASGAAKATVKRPAEGPGLAAARRVFDIEARGLKELARGLDHRFDAALDLLAKVKGRVVVSGMGKSGHIAHKIAATLASTGTPAFFVHPAEASHGDLGMVTRADAVLAISNSGSTAELGDLVAHTRRFSIPLIAVTADGASQLAEAADVVLELPNAQEACPLGLAPTTSTTITMALGDALAVALLERRGFTPDDFHVLHPGGRLGKKLLKVADIMHAGDEIPTVTPTALMDEVLVTMTAKRFGCAGVVKGGRLVGVITDGDLRRHMAPGLLRLKATDVMTPAPVTIPSRVLAAEALSVMNDRSAPVTVLFVVDGGRLTGILHIHDILRSGVA
jgi:arabinose-5-phosphate isomerase